MFIYPKAPEHQAPQVLATTMRAFDVVAERYGAENVVLVGTSAGGGLAVVVMAELRDRGSPQASLAVLISPGVDIALEQGVRVQPSPGGELTFSVVEELEGELHTQRRKRRAHQPQTQAHPKRIRTHGDRRSRPARAKPQSGFASSAASCAASGRR